MINAGKPKFCWLSASPHILAGCLVAGPMLASILPEPWNILGGILLLAPLLLIVATCVMALVGTIFRLFR